MRGGLENRILLVGCRRFSKNIVKFCSQGIYILKYVINDYDYCVRLYSLEFDVCQSVNLLLLMLPVQEGWILDIIFNPAGKLALMLKMFEILH